MKRQLQRNLYHCTPCAEYVYKWLLSEYKEPILNDAEKKYLSAVINPFKNRVNHIVKEENIDRSTEFIHIELHDGDVKANTMYKGMKVGKHYTLKELGL